jgi:hypothetical protein
MKTKCSSNIQYIHCGFIGYNIVLRETQGYEFNVISLF